MKNTIPRTVFILGLILLAHGMFAPIQAEIPIVNNTEPALPPRTIELEELWRVGGDDGDLIFGAIVEAVTDADHNVYLFDHHMKQVEVISPDGEHLRTLSREGDGPGEVRAPRDMVVLADGRIGLAELFPAKLVTLTPDGVPGETIILGGTDSPETGNTATLSCERRHNTFLHGGQRSVPGDVGMDRTQYLKMLNESGREICQLREATTVLDFTAGNVIEKELIPPFILVNAIGPDGRAYVPHDRESYAVEVYSPSGKLERIIQREYKNRNRTDREMKRMLTLFESVVRGANIQITFDIEKTNQSVASLFIDAENRLWVRHPGSVDDLPDGILAAYDLFDADGKYLQVVSIACEGQPDYDELKFLPDGRVLLIKGYVLAQWETFDTSAINWGEGEDSGSMEIVCYHLPF